MLTDNDYRILLQNAQRTRKQQRRDRQLGWGALTFILAFMAYGLGMIATGVWK